MWAYVGGVSLLDDLSGAEITYINAIDAAAKAESDAQYTADLKKLDASCGGLSQVTQRAEAFLPVPDPSGQRIWSQTLTDFQHLATACRNLVTNQSKMADDDANNADQQAYNAAQETNQYLASMSIP
jgi:hypothetical protein